MSGAAAQGPSGQSKAAAVPTEAKTIAEVLEERQKQLNELEQLADIQNSDMINQLTEDKNKGEKDKASVKVIQTSTNSQALAMSQSIDA